MADLSPYIYLDSLVENEVFFQHIDIDEIIGKRSEWSWKKVAAKLQNSRIYSLGSGVTTMFLWNFFTCENQSPNNQ